MQPISYIVSAIALFYVTSYVLASDGSQSDNCTSQFMSQERMDALLLRLNDHTGVGHTAVLTNEFAQGIFPSMNFTCNGNIQSLIFGAKWTDGSNQSFPELQIWRLRETESYIKVMSALIKVPRENTSQLYWYNLTSPLAFEAGDILGYYQPDILTCQLALYFDHQAEGGYSARFYGIKLNASSHDHDVSDLKNIPSVQPLLDVHVVTGGPTSVISTTNYPMVSGSSTSVMPTTSHPMVLATSDTSILTSQVLIYELSVTVTNTPIDLLLSLVPTRTITDDHTTFKTRTTHMMSTTTCMSSWTNQHFGSVTRLTTYQSVLLFTGVSSSHPPHVGKDPEEGPNKGISGNIYIISTAVMVLLVTVLVIIVVVLACMLQQRSREAMDELHMKKINGDSEVYSGSSIYEVISRYRVAQPASFQKSKAYKEQINPFYESSVDSDVDENEHEDVQLSLF